jgi:hypothetical protein
MNPKHQVLKISKTHIFVILLLPTILCCLFISCSFIGPNAQGEKDIWWISSLLFSLILWGILYLWSTSKFRIILSEDFIHLKSLFFDQKILIQNVGTYKLDKYGVHIYNKGQTEDPSILISVNLDHPDLLQFWLEKYSRNPALEAEIAAYEEDLKELKENSQYGKNQLEKTENLVQTHKIAKWLNGIAWFLFFGIGFGSVSSWNVPFMHLGVGISILIPIVLAYFSIRYQGFFNLELESPKTSCFSNASSALVAPSITLLIYWIFQEAYIFESTKVWSYAFLINVIILLPTLYFARDFSFKKLKDYVPISILFLCMFGYSYSTIAYINVYGDSSEASILPVKVLRKVAAKSSRDADQITLAPWNNSQKPYKIKVPQYYQVEKGDYILIRLKEGYLGIQHYEIIPYS